MGIVIRTKFIGYKILSGYVDEYSPDADQLTNKVKLYLEDGWRLVGSPYVDNEELFHYQAVVKYKNVPG